MTPTIYALTSIVDVASSPPDPRQKYVARSMKELGMTIAGAMSPEEVAEIRRRIAELREVVRELDRFRVVLLAGTDLAASRLPGFGLHEELALLCDAGLTPLEALRAATLAPARVLGKEADLGSVEKGKLADLVLLAANPLDDIHSVARIEAVIVGGKLLARADLDALLRQAEQLAAMN